jgi:hypothetical protein
MDIPTSHPCMSVSSGWASLAKAGQNIIKKQLILSTSKQTRKGYVLWIFRLENARF